MTTDYSLRITIGLERSDSEDSQGLIGQLDQELLRRYPLKRTHGLHPQDMTDPNFTFLVARIGDKAVEERYAVLN